MATKDMQEFVNLRDEARNKVIKVFQQFPGGTPSSPQDSVPAEQQAFIKEANEAWNAFVSKAKSMGMKV